MKTENPTEARKGPNRSRLLPALAGTGTLLLGYAVALSLGLVLDSLLG
jgi:hypothetical protein